MNDSSIANQLVIDESLPPLVEFKRIANVVLNNLSIIATNTNDNEQEEFQIAELEFYFRSEAHDDVFAHCDERQKMQCAWYFHRQGKNYKSGTYVGLDIAIGHEKAFGGILIRSVRRVSDDALIQGSCLSARAILGALGVDSVPEIADALLESDRLGAASTDQAHPLRLVESDEARSHVVFSSMRVGLTLKKKTEVALRKQFIGAPYRFLTEPKAIRKGVIHTAIGLLSSGECSTAKALASATKKTEASCATLIEEHAKGKSSNLDAFVGKGVKASELARLHGAWLAHNNDE